MGEDTIQLVQLQAAIDRLLAGDQAARGELVEHASRRLLRLTRQMLKGFSRLKRWEETDDVCQNAMMRLLKALQEVTPHSTREFLALAALQIRRELLDLARKYYGPEGIGANQASHILRDDSNGTPAALSNKADSTMEPDRLAIWTEFHRRIDALPEEEREMFDVLWYQGLTQGEAATLLGISLATLKRRWQSARLRLHDMLQGGLPGM
jgi:RNA polymerase sigma-70 factor (ECF subfamily)